MKEAFGGTFILKMFMIFFIIYVTFIFIVLNFAKHYRIKNYVVNFLEQSQYNGDASSLDNSDLDTYLRNVPYNVPNSVADEECKKVASSNNYQVFDGVCIIQYGEKKNGVIENPYYKVTVYFGASFPFFGLRLTIPISGETTVIYQPK